VSCTYEDKDGKQSIQVDKLIVCVGRRPSTGNLFAEDVELLLDERGLINVDEYCRTNLPGRLCHRRRGARPDAGPQGLGRGRDGRRADRRQAGA
jgi:hypothetical protein